MRGGRLSTLRRRNGDGVDTLVLAAVFGLASVPWTYAFVAELHLPLWPSFVASGTFYAAGGGLRGLVEGYASNTAGIAYAVATIWIVDGHLGGTAVALSLVVGAAMFLASLHEDVALLSFVPGGFFGYATMFGVHAAGASAFGVGGLAGETLAAVTAMLIGAAIGIATEQIAETISL